ncbi:Uncharacterised protein [Paucimonas lemoignei]|nr:Uncharacterised protein [Paucimonas lemoignei]
MAALQMIGEPALPIKQGLVKLKAQFHTNQDVYYAPLRQTFFDVVRMEQRTIPYDKFRQIQTSNHVFASKMA